VARASSKPRKSPVRPARGEPLAEEKLLPSGPPNAGAAELQAIADRHGGPHALARSLGSKEATVRSWLVGKAKPSTVARKALREAYGIAWTAWDSVAPVGGAIVPSKPRYEPEPALAADASARDRAQHQVDALRKTIERAKGENVGFRELASLEGAYTSALNQLARLTGETEITEASILRSPAWARIMRVVREVLESHGQGLAGELATALERLAEDGA